METSATMHSEKKIKIQTRSPAVAKEGRPYTGLWRTANVSEEIVQYSCLEGKKKSAK